MGHVTMNAQTTTPGLLLACRSRWRRGSPYQTRGTSVNVKEGVERTFDPASDAVDQLLARTSFWRGNYDNDPQLRQEFL